MNWYCMPCRSATFSSIGVLQERILDLVADPATHAHRKLLNHRLPGLQSLSSRISSTVIWNTNLRNLLCRYLLLTGQSRVSSMHGGDVLQ